VDNDDYDTLGEDDEDDDDDSSDEEDGMGQCEFVILCFTSYRSIHFVTHDEREEEENCLKVRCQQQQQKKKNFGKLPLKQFFLLRYQDLKFCKALV
jgi:hypothetical protein